tara:strand:+ start:82 stop:801 length:720 start_codon:yes stop_codon:yes gene_type:complete
MKVVIIFGIGVVFIIMVIFITIAIKKKKFRKQILTPKQLEFVHNKLKSMLTRFTSVLHKHGYNYFIIGGTLLGCIREGDIISHDDDIDLAMMKDDIEIMLNDHNLLEDLKNNNLQINHPHLKEMSYKIRNIKNDSIFDKSRIFIDLFSYSKFESSVDNNNIIHFTEKKAREIWSYFFYENELYPLQIMYLDNIPVFGPNNPIPCLERSYGKDWMTPIFTHSHSYELNINKDCYGECFLF